MRTEESTLAIRRVLGKRFAIAPHQIKTSDIKILMGYMHMGDLGALSPEEVDAFVSEGRRNGLLLNNVNSGGT